MKINIILLSLLSSSLCAVEEKFFNENNLTQQYTIIEFFTDSTRSYQVALKLKEKERIQFISYERETFDQALIDLRVALQYDPEMTGKFANKQGCAPYYDFINSIVYCHREVTDADKLIKISEVWNDPLYLHHKRLHDLMRKNGSTFHERACDILHKLSNDPCSTKHSYFQKEDGNIHIYPTDGKKFRPLEQLGYILAKFYAFNVEITHYDIEKLEKLSQSGQTLDELREQTKNDFYNYFYKE